MGKRKTRKQKVKGPKPQAVVSLERENTEVIPQPLDNIKLRYLRKDLSKTVLLTAIIIVTLTLLIVFNPLG